MKNVGGMKAVPGAVGLHLAATIGQSQGTTHTTGGRIAYHYYFSQ